jgi:hypothetical protein
LRVKGRFRRRLSYGRNTLALERRRMEYDAAALRSVQEHIGSPDPALVEKDFHILKALEAIAAIDTAPLRLVFGGGTALSRATGSSSACPRTSI